MGKGLDMYYTVTYLCVILEVIPMIDLQSPAAVSCPPNPELQERSLLSPSQAGDLARVFKVLASDTRLRLLHALVRSGELCVNELSASVEMKAQAVSNQLQRLVTQGILGCRRDGNNIYYRIEDPCVVHLLEHGVCLTERTQERGP